MIFILFFRAHILAFENPESQGRYLCCNETISMSELVDFLRPKYPDYPIPTKNLTGWLGSWIVTGMSYFQPKGVGQFLRTNLCRVPTIDNSKIKKELNLEFIDIYKTFEGK